MTESLEISHSVEFSDVLSTPQKTFFNDLIYNIYPPPTPSPHPYSLTLHRFILVHFSSQHWLPPDVWYLFLCLFAYCLSPQHVELRSGTLFCSLLRSTYNNIWHVQFSSVAQSCLTLCDPMNRSTPGLPVHHQLLEFTQTHVHLVGDAIQPSHPVSSPSPPAPNPSQHQGLFQ